MSNQAKTQNNTKLVWISIISAIAASLIGVIVALRWRRQRAKKAAIPEKTHRPLSPFDYKIDGLSEAEAEARRLEGQDNSVQFKPQRTRRQAIRQNTFSIFNLSLVGLAVVQLLLGNPLDALMSLGVMLFNIALNTFQEFFARKRIQQVELSTRLKATVVREGKTRSIDPSEIVVGDMLLAGPGDQIPVDGEIVGDGEILVDDSVLNIESSHGVKGEGEKLYAGSICLTGQAAYQATQVGPERRIVSVLSDVEAVKQELTPIQKIINQILRILLIVVALLLLMLLSINYRLDLGIPTDVLIDAASVIFSIAPAGLFFMILLTYAAGTADLAKIGALVRQARSVESLAQVNVMCFAKGGVLTGTDVEIEPISKSDNAGELEKFADSRIRQILGDYARSTAVPNPKTRALLYSFEGNRRTFTDESPYLSIYGWSAITFNENDLRGVYVLGDPEILDPYFAEVGEAAEDEKEKPAKGVSLRKTISRLGGIFKRSKDEASEGESVEAVEGLDRPPGHETTKVESFEPEDGEQNSNPEGSETTSLTEREQTKPNFFKRALKRVNRVIRREAEAEGTEGEHQGKDTEQVELIFAYYPEIIPIHDEHGTPKLSENLIPLCKLHFSEKVRPETVETIRKFAQNKVSIKIFSSDPAEQTATLLKQIEFGYQEDVLDGEISGDELAKLTPAQMVHAAQDNTIFGQISPMQAAQVVGALRANDQFVAVLGDGVKDVPALRMADLAIAMQTSSQAAMSQADIILLEDSPDALQRVLEKGQRIVKGLLDILKLYLTQVVYLALLIISMRVFSLGFPYSAAQGSAIAIFTLTIPSLGLTFWASSGVMNSANLRRILGRFVLPAALTMSTAGMLVYRYFLQTTGDMDYAQLTVTYTLVSVGLVLVIFVKPPGRLWAGGASLTGDWRLTGLVIFLQAAFFLTVWIPLAQKYLKVEPLHEPIDYLIIGLVVVCWAITLRLAWWFWPLKQVIRKE